MGTKPEFQFTLDKKYAVVSTGRYVLASNLFLTALHQRPEPHNKIDVVFEDPEAPEPEKTRRKFVAEEVTLFHDNRRFRECFYMLESHQYISPVYAAIVRSNDPKSKGTIRFSRKPILRVTSEPALPECMCQPRGERNEPWQDYFPLAVAVVLRNVITSSWTHEELEAKMQKIGVDNTDGNYLLGEMLELGIVKGMHFVHPSGLAPRFERVMTPEQFSEKFRIPLPYDFAVTSETLGFVHFCQVPIQFARRGDFIEGCSEMRGNVQQTHQISVEEADRLLGPVLTGTRALKDDMLVVVGVNPLVAVHIEQVGQRYNLKVFKNP